MADLKNVLMVSKPISPPWQDSNKNLTKNIISYVNNVHFHILTPKGYHFDKDNVTSEDIYQSKGDYAPGLQQNLQALFYLMTENKHIDLFHYFFTPNPKTSTVLKHFTKFKNKPSIQTVLSSPRDYTNIKDLIFGDRVVVLSDYNKQKLEEAGVNNVVRIYPGLDLKEVDNFSPSALEFRVKNDLLTNYLILYPGDYEFSGANKAVLEAVPPVVSKFPDAKFIFACRAKTEESKKIEAELKDYAIDLGIEKYVMFLGTADDMLEVMRSIDICIFPVKSLYAKMDIPLVLLEAMAYAKPIIISDIEPLNEIMKAEAGYKITPGDIDGLVKHLLELLGSSSLRIEKGFAGRKIVEQHFNMKELSKEYENLYQELLYE